MKTLINMFCFFIPIANVCRPLRKKLMQIWNRHKNKLTTFQKHLNGKPIILWVDHALGGGTESYSKIQFKKLKNKYDVIRLQYFPATKMYHLSKSNNKNRVFKTTNIYEIFNFCTKQNIIEIVVNNLVGYQSTTNMLKIISNLKQQCTSNPSVSFRGHDFQCICPSFNLINCDNKYCDLEYIEGCENCWKKKRLSEKNTSHNVLKSGATTIREWRQAWHDFLGNTADKIVLFSDAIEKIFAYAYPDITDKIIIIPHEVKKYKTVKIKPHKDINIAILGNISQQKGADVVKEMAALINDKSNINIIIIGKMNNAPKNTIVNGTYKPKQLPKLMKKYDIDIVFIPSIWPETFSYTTSEAMSMNLPVACYDMGAPAERVSQYKKGLVLNEINPTKNLNQIINFIKKIK